MKILVLGGGGMIGQKLAQRLASGGLDLTIDELILHDIIAPRAPDASFPVTCLTGDFCADASKLAALRPDLIFHLAAIVSGEAEQDFPKGWEINARGSWSLLEALRAAHDDSTGTYRPRVVFGSSIAVFGAPLPDVIPDDYILQPLSSYGAQKAMTELLVTDYARKGFIEGISIRFPTISVRPGRANKAASSFFSGIIREPLNGKEAILPVADIVRHFHASPLSAARFLTHAATLDLSRLEGRPALTMPGLSCTVAEQIAALERIAGSDVARLIRHEPDPLVAGLVHNWPGNFDTARATALGFEAERQFDEIIQSYITHDLPHAAR